MRVVIIGAGHAGITLAYFFKNEGLDVLVIEKDFVAGGETGYSTGIFPSREDVLKFYREIEEYTLGYFRPLIYDHVRGSERGKSIYVDGYNYAYYTSIVLEKEGVQFEVMNPFFKFEGDGRRISQVITKRGSFKGDVFIVAAGGTTPFIVDDFKDVSFRWIRSLLLKPRKRFETVIYDDEFVLKPEGDRVILREEKGVKVKPDSDVINKTRGVDEDFYGVVAEYFERKHPELMDASIERAWATLCMEAKKPVFKVRENLFAFAGFGCYGFGQIPKLAEKLVKEVILK